MGDPRREAALLRIRATMLRLGAAHLDLHAAAVDATAGMRRFARAFCESIRRDFESHPDVQEAVAQMRGFYEV